MPSAVERERRRIRPPSPKRTPEEARAFKAEIVRRYKAGMAHIDIARDLAISVPYCSKVCREAGLGVAAGARPRVASARTTEREAMERLVLELYDGGMAHVDIAKTLGIGLGRSHLICRAAGRSRANGTHPRKRRG